MEVLKQKVKNINVKTILLIITYISISVLAVTYFSEIISAVSQFMSIIAPFIYGSIIAFIFQIPEPFFEKHIKIKNINRRRLIASILSIILVILIASVIFLTIIPQIIENLSVLINDLPYMIRQCEKYIEVVIEHLNLSNDLVIQIEEYQNNISRTLLSSMSSLMPSFITTIKSLANGIMNLFMGIIIAIYLSLDKDKLSKQINKVNIVLFNEKQAQYNIDAAKLMVRTFKHFFTGQVTESFIIGILCYIGCKILSMPYAFITAIIIAITNIIPYFGPWIGTGLSAFLILFVSPIKAVEFIIFGVVLQQFESNLIYPHVVGNSVGLSALWVLFAITIGGGLFGIVGMVFGLPVFSVIYELVKRYINVRYKRKQEEISS